MVDHQSDGCHYFRKGETIQTAYDLIYVHVR